MASPSTHPTHSEEKTGALLTWEDELWSPPAFLEAAVIHP